MLGEVPKPDEIVGAVPLMSKWPEVLFMNAGAESWPVELKNANFELLLFSKSAMFPVPLAARTNCTRSAELLEQEAQDTKIVFPEFLDSKVRFWPLSIVKGAPDTDCMKGLLAVPAIVKIPLGANANAGLVAQPERTPAVTVQPVSKSKMSPVSVVG
jgi:hypothetical protein